MMAGAAPSLHSCNLSSQSPLSVYLNTLQHADLAVGAARRAAGVIVCLVYRGIRISTEPALRWELCEIVVFLALPPSSIAAGSNTHSPFSAPDG